MKGWICIGVLVVVCGVFVQMLLSRPFIPIELQTVSKAKSWGPSGGSAHPDGTVQDFLIEYDATMWELTKKRLQLAVGTISPGVAADNGAATDDGTDSGGEESGKGASGDAPSSGTGGRALTERLHTTGKIGSSSWDTGIDYNFFTDTLKYWGEQYDWESEVGRLNTYPQKKVWVKGLGIHTIQCTITGDVEEGMGPGCASAAGTPDHDTLAIVLLHGWPGSIAEFLGDGDSPGMLQRMAERLRATSTAKRLDVVIPTLPGFGYSDFPRKPGMDTVEVAHVFNGVLHALGYKKWAIQAGDWGAMVGSGMVQLEPEAAAGIHLNFFLTLPPTNWEAIKAFGFPSLFFSPLEQAKTGVGLGRIGRLMQSTGYMHEMATKPDTVGGMIGSSPSALAAWILEKFFTWSDCRLKPCKNADKVVTSTFTKGGSVHPLFGKGSADSSELECNTPTEADPEGFGKCFSKKFLVTNLMFYWASGSAATSPRIYKEALWSSNTWASMQGKVDVPAGILYAPREMAYQHESWVPQRFTQLKRVTHIPIGGHFAAAEVPGDVADDFVAFLLMIGA